MGLLQAVRVGDTGAGELTTGGGAAPAHQGDRQRLGGGTVADDAHDAVSRNVVELARGGDHQVLAWHRLGEAEYLRHDTGPGPCPGPQGAQHHGTAPGRAGPPGRGTQTRRSTKVRSGRRRQCRVIERRDDGEYSLPVRGDLRCDGIGCAHDLSGCGAGAAVQLLSLPGAQGGDPGQSRARPAQSSQGDVVSQDQSDAAPSKQPRGRRSAPEGVQGSGPAVVDGRA